MTESIGTVAVLRRYPVKSMLGEELRAADVTERGLAGDRALALVHRPANHGETSKVVSAKNPRLWRNMLKLAATSGPEVKITFPNGTALTSSDPQIDAALSEFLGRPVTLAAAPPAEASLDRADPEEVLRAGIDAEVRMDVIEQVGAAAPDGTFFDYAPLHLITTSTLVPIAELSPRGAVELERYRPNLVIRTTAEGFTENDWVGRELLIGPELAVRIINRTPRCAIPTLEHGDLPRDTDALRVPAAHNRICPADDWSPAPCVGVHGQVIRPGRIELGDEVRLRAAG